MLVRRLPRVTLIVGKGGVGKTTAAAALALEASRSIGRTLVLTTDPARALPTVLDCPVDPEAAAVPYAPRLEARVLDAAVLRSRFMRRWGGTIALIFDRGTYLDDEDIGPLVETALPGSDEIFAALELAQLLAAEGAGGAPERIIVDTAPTGHTVRLLSLPRTFRALVQLLDTMQGKHRLMVRALARGYRMDDADAFLREMTRLVDSLEEALGDPSRCAAVMITSSAPLVQEETRRYLAALGDLGVHVGAIVWNQSEPVALDGAAPGYLVPRLQREPVGERGLTLWVDALRIATVDDKGGTRRRTARTDSKGGQRRPTARRNNDGGQQRRTAATQLDSLLRPLTIVAGKGGVGKTTVAAALALHSARGAPTLVVSTDPAPSLADAFAQEIGDADVSIAGMTRLFARQMDASAAFARLRDRYQSRVDAVFDGLVGGRGVDFAHDRAIVRDLLALAPPGIDEIYALSLLAEALFERQYDHVIVDPAPTGHLLRLLDMPRTALAWSHQLMRLMLKYKEIGGLGDAAADVLAFARNLRALDTLLHDPARAAVLVVTLDEGVVAAETARLVAEITSRGLAVAGVVLNRAARATTFPLPPAPMHLQAPHSTPPPVGRAQLHDWAQSWMPLTS
jgi:arsenite-transporting ATPase